MARITVRAGDYEATFRPDVAMLCASLRHRGDEYVAWPRRLSEFKAGGATAIPLVHPWANRLGRWGYSVDRRRVDLRPLDLPADHAGLPIHGNMFDARFDVVRADDTRVVASFDYGAHPEKLRAFPFPHVLTIEARVHPERGLAIVTTIEPTSERAVPISFGWHPYVRLPHAPRTEWELHWPACQHVEVDNRIIPTGVRNAQPASRAVIAHRTFDDHYALGRDRTFAIAARERTLTLRFDSAYPYAQLFVPPRRQLVAIEPMTAEIDALGSRTAPRCAPGDRFQAAFSLRITR